MEITSKEELNKFLQDVDGRLSNLQESFDKANPVEDEEPNEDNEETEENSEESEDEVSEEELDEIEEMFQD